jgi:Tol biopolymer transport system component
MRRFAYLLTTVAAVALISGCGSGTPRVSAVAPMRNVLVYSKLPPGTYGDTQMWVAAPTGKHARSLGVGGAVPQVSPDGRFVAYDNVDDGSVRVVPTAGGKPMFAGVGQGPIWAPNSRFVAFNQNDGGLDAADVETGKPVTTTTVAHGSLYRQVGAFDFSPDSRRIVYAKSHDLYVVPTSGGTPVRLTHGHVDYGPVWGPRGIAFVRFSGADGDIWLIDKPGAAAHQLTHGANYGGLWPAFFSADGRELLAFNQDIDARVHPAQLWAVALPSGRLRLLPLHQHAISALGLSRDGKTVLADNGCYGNLETVPFTGGKPHVIYHGVDACQASWNR